MPWPLKDGGAIGIYRITEAFSKLNHEVDLLSFNTKKHHVEESILQENLNPICNVYSVDINTDISLSGAILNLFSPIPYHVSRFSNKTFQNKLIDLLQKNKYDFIHIDGIFLGNYIATIRKYTDAKIILRAHNVEYLIWQRLAKESSFFKKIYLQYLTKKLKKYEIKTWQEVDVIAAITEPDNILIKNENIKTPTIVLTSGIDPIQFPLQKYNFPIDFFYVGSMEWMPNIQAINWLIKTVLNPLAKDYKDFKFHLAGRKLSKNTIPNLPTFIENHGEVESVIDFVKNKNIAIIPLQAGGGMRIKILELMALGKCIITTNIGAEGINYTDGENILIANTSDEFINKIVYCMRNTENTMQIGLNARNFIVNNYDNTSLIKNYITQLQEKKLI